MHDAYLNLLRQYPCLVASSGSPLKIITDEAVCSKMGVGIAYSDSHIHLLKDVVHFQNNTTSVFKRILLKHVLHKKHPVAILPITSDNKVALIKIWRHATQCWHLEIPRGMSEGDETALEAARRELFEETGYQAQALEPVGSIYPDSGILNYQVCVFIAQVGDRSEYVKDPTECIEEVILVEQSALQQNSIMHEGVSYPLTDPFLAYALFRRQGLKQ